MVEVVRTNFAPIFSDFENFTAHWRTNRSAPSDNFLICSIHGKSFSSPKKTLQTCERNLNRPTNADATSS